MDSQTTHSPTLAKSSATSNREATAQSDAVFTKYANATLPKRSALTAGLEAYAGTWDARHASHLLRRTLFGYTASDLAKAKSLTAATCVDALLDSVDEVIAPPVSVDALKETVPIGQTWVTADYDGTITNVRGRSLQAWWMNLMVNQKFSIREKMVLFWHNQLPTEIDAVGDPRLSYLQNVLQRKFALGNFRDLVKEITLDSAMLRYLNGNTNTNKNPNENFGRELQELFTIGKGPEISAGNYTNYTEDDVKAAARVMTGWVDVRLTMESVFVEKNHDVTDKVFSDAYGGKIIKGRAGVDGALEVDDLLDMIFAQAETARYLCRKLYRFFVYYAIDAQVETNVIGPMAAMLQANGYEVKPVIASLLKSAHFHDVLNLGCMIKNPLDHVVGTFRQLEMTRPDGVDPVKSYAFLNVLVTEASRMQMEIGNPPNVAGWAAYYQNPVFYELWINSDTLPRRVQLTDILSSAKGYVYYSADKNATNLDPIALAKLSTKPGTITTLISDLADLFYPITLTDLQLAYLKRVMLDTLPDYEWAAEWDPYLATPADLKLRSAVENRLRALFVAMMQLAEYQLC